MRHIECAARRRAMRGQVVLGPFLETLIGGLLTGVLYSLVALGFVLIFKASGVFNFAQGSMVLFAAMTLARLAGWVPLPLAFALAALIMIALAYAIEFLVLRRLVNQPDIILFMATIGISYFLDGFGQTLWGSDILELNLHLPKNPIFILESVSSRRPADRPDRIDRRRRLRGSGHDPCDRVPGDAIRSSAARGRR